MRRKEGKKEGRKKGREGRKKRKEKKKYIIAIEIFVHFTILKLEHDLSSRKITIFRHITQRGMR